MIIDFLKILRRVASEYGYEFSRKYRWRSGRWAPRISYPAVMVRSERRLITWTTLTERTFQLEMPWTELPYARRVLEITLRNYPYGEGIRLRAPEVWDAAWDMLYRRLERFRPVSRITILVINSDNRRPIRNATVTIEPANPNVITTPDVIREAVTTPTGRVAFDYINRGNALITVETENFEPYSEWHRIQFDGQEIIIEQEPIEEMPREVWVRWKTWAYWRSRGGGERRDKYTYEREVDVFIWTQEEEAPSSRDFEDLIEHTFTTQPISPVDGSPYPERAVRETWADYQEDYGQEPESSPMFREGSRDHPTHASPVNWGDSGIRLELPTDPNDPEYDEEARRDMEALSQTADWEYWRRRESSAPSKLSHGTFNRSRVVRTYGRRTRQRRLIE